jgi:hypothetical protein
MAIVSSGSMKDKGANKVLVPEGPTIVRLVGYVEQGEHEQAYVEKGTKKTKTQRKATIVLQDMAEGHALVTQNGKVNPLLFITVACSTHPRSRMVALFNRLNHDGEADAFTDVLGKAYVLEVKHAVVGESTYANVMEETVKPPVERSIGTNITRPIEVPEATCELFAFVWEPQGISDKAYLESYQQLQERYKDKIKTSLTFGRSRLKRLLDSVVEEDEVEDEALADALDL